MSPLGQIRRKASAFTLIEVLTVIALIAILASIVAVSIQGVKERTGITRARAELAVLAQGLEGFKRRYGDYPQTVPMADASTASAILFHALAGGGGPDGVSGTGGGGPVFVEASKLTLEISAAIVAGNAPPGSAFINPWGRRYIYWSERTDSPPTGFLLFSMGPDGATTRLGATDGSRGGNATEGVDADDILAGEMP